MCLCVYVRAHSVTDKLTLTKYRNMHTQRWGNRKRGSERKREIEKERQTNRQTD